MDVSLNKLVGKVDELNNKLFTNTYSIKEFSNKLEFCSNQFCGAVNELVEKVGALESVKVSGTQSKDDDFSIDTALGVLGFAGITFPGLMNELSDAICKVLVSGISIPELLVKLGNFTISSPVGMEIGIQILDDVNNWISDNFGQGVLDALSASFTVGFSALVGGSFGGPIGALIGAGIGLVIDGFYYDEYTTKIWDAIKKNIFNLDETTALYDIMFENFGSIDSADNILEIGKKVVIGIIAGILGALTSFTEPWTDLFKWVSEGICKVFGINSPAEEMKPLGENILLGIVQGFEDTFYAWTESIQTFWNENIIPWFSLDTWSELGENIKIGLIGKWDEFTNWWKTTGLYNWWTEDVAPNFTKEKWDEFGENIKAGLSEKWGAFTTWWETTGLYNWWTEDVAPNFTKEKWDEFGENIKAGLSEKWGAFTTWWETTGLYNWWTEDVTPNFTKEKWNEFGENIKTGLSEKWGAFTEWWKNTGLYKWWNDEVKPWFDKEEWTWDGIKDGLGQAFNNAIDVVKKIWNGFANWLNEKLVISWDSFSFKGYEIIPAGSFKLGEIPTFYDGGFPEDSSLFWAGEYGEPELLGTIGGRTAVASGAEITGITEAVYHTGQEESSLLKTAINLLQEIADKNMSVNIGDREIARANYRGQKSLGTRLITDF